MRDWRPSNWKKTSWSHAWNIHLFIYLLNITEQYEYSCEFLLYFLFVWLVLLIIQFKQGSWKQYIFWNPKEHYTTRLEWQALVFLVYFLQAAALDWLHMCSASEALSGVAYSSLVSLSMAQWGSWILGRRLLFMRHLRLSKSLGKMPDPPVNYLPSWWLLLKSLSADM